MIDLPALYARLIMDIGDGTGMASRADAGGNAVFQIPSDAGGRLMLVHAKDAKGNWGPLKAVFTR